MIYSRVELMSNDEKTNVQGLFTLFSDYIKELLKTGDIRFENLYKYYKRSGNELQSKKFKNSPILVDYVLYGFLILTKILVDAYNKKGDNYTEVLEIFSKISSEPTKNTNSKPNNNNYVSKQIKIEKKSLMTGNIPICFSYIQSAYTYDTRKKGQLFHGIRKTFYVVHSVIGIGNKMKVHKSKNKNKYKPIPSTNIGLRTINIQDFDDELHINYVDEKENDDSVIKDLKQFETNILNKINYKLGDKKNKKNVVLYGNKIGWKNLLLIGILAYHSDEFGTYISKQSIKNAKKQNSTQQVSSISTRKYKRSISKKTRLTFNRRIVLSLNKKI